MIQYEFSAKGAVSKILTWFSNWLPISSLRLNNPCNWFPEAPSLDSTKTQILRWRIC